jgi:predicted nucleotide-binding protein (sugar kinase/HSP70/actin superfamily)
VSIIERPSNYRAYAPRHFTPEDRNSTTILFGGANWRLERLLEGVFANLGYKSKALPRPSRDDLVRGRELADVGQCCPTTFTTGNLANFLLAEKAVSGAEDVCHRYVYVTAGSCGACRFGQYHQSYELALRNLGLDAFRMYLLAQDGIDQGALPGGGLRVDAHLTLGAIMAALCSDAIRDLEFQLRPYEVVEGSVNAASHAAIEDLHKAFVSRPLWGKKWGAIAWHLTTDYFLDALRQARARFEHLRFDRLRMKPRVAVTGEFFLQTTESDANHKIHAWLESEGAEVYPSLIGTWLDYNLRFYRQHFEDRVGLERFARLKAKGLRVASRVAHRTYDRIRHSLGNVPRAMPDQDEIRRLASPYFNSRLSGGEGDMLIGKSLLLHLNKKAHMICELSPYGCMPNTMSVGAMSAAIGRYPDLLYAPLEIKGDAEIHALSRCQMILTEAKRRAQKEFEAALNVTGLTVDAARARLAQRPDLCGAFSTIPSRGAAGLASSVILELEGKSL